MKRWHGAPEVKLSIHTWVQDSEVCKTGLESAFALFVWTKGALIFGADSPSGPSLRPLGLVLVLERNLRSTIALHLLSEIASTQAHEGVLLLHRFIPYVAMPGLWQLISALVLLHNRNILHKMQEGGSDLLLLNALCSFFSKPRHHLEPHSFPSFCILHFSCVSVYIVGCLNKWLPPHPCKWEENRLTTPSSKCLNLSF